MTTGQRSAIKVCVLNAVSRKDAFQMLKKAYGLRAMENHVQGIKVICEFQKSAGENHRRTTEQSVSVKKTSRHVTVISKVHEQNCCITREICDKVDRHCAWHFTQQT